MEKIIFKYKSYRLFMKLCKMTMHFQLISKHCIFFVFRGKNLEIISGNISLALLTFKKLMLANSSIFYAALFF